MSVRHARLGVPLVVVARRKAALEAALPAITSAADRLRADVKRGIFRPLTEADKAALARYTVAQRALRRVAGEPTHDGHVRSGTCPRCLGLRTPRSRARGLVLS